MSRLTESKTVILDGNKIKEHAFDLYWALKHYKDLEEQGRLVEQKHGKWIHEDVDWVCSECGEDAPTIPFKGKQYRANYCSYCGAKMDEVEDERKID